MKQPVPGGDFLQHQTEGRLVDVPRVQLQPKNLVFLGWWKVEVRYVEMENLWKSFFLLKKKELELMLIELTFFW